MGCDISKGFYQWVFIQVSGLRKTADTSFMVKDFAPQETHHSLPARRGEPTSDNWPQLEQRPSAAAARDQVRWSWFFPN